MEGEMQVERRDYVAPQLTESDVDDTASGRNVDASEDALYRLS